METTFRCPTCGFVFSEVSRAMPAGAPIKAQVGATLGDGSCPDCAVRRERDVIPTAPSPDRGDSDHDS